MLTVGLMSACSKKALDLQPLDQFGQEAVWGDLGLMQTFVNNIYYGIYHGFDGKIGMQMLTDEAMRVSDRGAANVTNSLVSPSDYSVFGSTLPFGLTARSIPSTPACKSVSIIKPSS